MGHSEKDDQSPNDENDHNHDSGDEEDVAVVMALLDDEEKEEEDQQQHEEEEEEEEEQDDTNHDIDDDIHEVDMDHSYHSVKSRMKLNYYSLSLLLAVGHVIYAIRSREQLYLALLYLSSSRLSVSCNT
jgi:hypothetical protein